MIEEPRLFKNLKIYESLVKIILENQIKMDYSFPEYITKKQTFNLVSNYYEKDRDYYNIILKKLDKEKRIKFKKRKNNNYNEESGIITLDYTKTINDVYSLVNLFERYIGEGNYNSDILNLFKEVMPIYEEFRVYDYLKELDIAKDAKRQMNNNLTKNSFIATNALKESEIYKIYKEENALNSENLNFDLYEYFIQDRKYYNASIDIYGTYFFGYIMAIYIKYCLDNKDISRALKSIQKMTIEDISDILNLNLSLDDNGLYIPDEDINKLNKIYKLEMSKYNAK